MVKKRRKPSSRRPLPPPEKIQNVFSTSDNSLAQSENSFINRPNILSGSENIFNHKDERPIPKPTHPPQPTQPPPPPPTPPIPHIKHTLSPEENFPAIIVTPRSTQGILSSQQISERNRNKDVDTLADIARENREQLERDDALLVTREQGRSSQGRSRNNKVFTNFARTQERQLPKVPKRIQSPQPQFVVDKVKQRNEERFQRLLEKAESVEAEERFQTKFQQENPFPERFENRQTFIPAQQQQSNARITEERVNFSNNNVGNIRRLEEKISFKNFPEPEERFAEINSADTASLTNIQTIASKDGRNESPVRSPFRQDQILDQLEQPRSSNDFFQQRFNPKSLFDNFPSFSAITPNSDAINRPSPPQFLDFGPFTSNINMEDGSYTIQTVF